MEERRRWLDVARRQSPRGQIPRRVLWLESRTRRTLLVAPQRLQGTSATEGALPSGASSREVRTGEKKREEEREEKRRE
jgi:hypothetical protein